MKLKCINIISRHAIVNYGSILQAKATEEFFISLGFTCQIIDYVAKVENVGKRIHYYSSNAKIKGLKKVLYKVIKLPSEIIKEKKFNKYRKRYLNLGKRYTSLEELKKEDFSDAYLCAGSDQLWGYMPYNQIDPAYFLDFGSEKNKYFSFSASLGRTDFDEEYYRSLNKYLNKFSFITVREQSGVSLIEKYTPYKAEHVLDPTLIMGREFWHSFADKKIKEKPYILLYQLRWNKKIDRYVKELAKKKGLRVIRVSTSVYDYTRFGKKKILKAPDYVLSLFREAQCVVTDSFHATVFSLVFNRKFIDFLPPTTHERISDLLEVVGLSDRTATWTEKDFEIIDNEIDWQRVNAVLEEKRKESCEIVKRGLAALENEEE